MFATPEASDRGLARRRRRGEFVRRIPRSRTGRLAGANCEPSMAARGGANERPRARRASAGARARARLAPRARDGRASLAAATRTQRRPGAARLTGPRAQCKIGRARRKTERRQAEGRGAKRAKDAKSPPSGVRNRIASSRGRRRSSPSSPTKGARASGARARGGAAAARVDDGSGRVCVADGARARAAAAKHARTRLRRRDGAVRRRDRRAFGVIARPLGYHAVRRVDGGRGDAAARRSADSRALAHGA